MQGSSELGFQGQDQGVMWNSVSSSAYLSCFLGTLLHSEERVSPGDGGCKSSPGLGGDREIGSSCGAYLRSMLVLLGVGWAAESRGHDGEEDRWFPHSECYAEGQVW